VKHFSCFFPITLRLRNDLDCVGWALNSTHSLTPITVGIRCLRLVAQTAKTDCDWLNSYQHFTAVLAFRFG